MARRTTTTSAGAASPPTPSGVLFFVHGANSTSEGLVENLARIEDQVRARGWDVTVVAQSGAADRTCAWEPGGRRSIDAAVPHRCRSRS